MDNTKHLTLFDSKHAKDDASLHKTHLRGEVIFKKIGTDEPILTLHNKVVIAGSQFIAQKCFNLPANVPKVCLFCCGTKGCGTENSQVYPVNYTKRIAPDGDLVPFRYQLKQNDLSDEMRAKYFGRKETTDRYAYYFKAFESDPKTYMRFVDGTIIDANLYDSQNEKDAETFVEMSMQITKDDFRDYFRATTSINDAKINSISLLTAWYTESGGYKWYQNIIPLTQLNIPNEPLIDLTKGIDITYHIYF